VPFGALFSARLAGEAFNLTTPTASVGGEAVKAWLIRHHAPLEEALPSVIVAKTTITIAQGLLLIAGLPCAWALLPHDSPLVPASIGALEGGHVAIFTALGLGGTWGMSFSIVRRIREATWIGIGFLALAAYRGFVPAPAAAGEH